MEPRELANVRTGASMVIAGDRSIVLQGDYKETRDGTNYHFYAQNMGNYFGMPLNRQIQDSGVRSQNDKDYAAFQHNFLSPPSIHPTIPKPLFPGGIMENSSHKSPFKELTYLKCEVCHQFIPRNSSGLFTYSCHPFWSQKYCPSHEYDNTARCCSCERLESWNARYFILEDGRSICKECWKCSVIYNSDDCQPLYDSIRDFYEGMSMKIDQQISLCVVQRKVLNDAIVGEKDVMPDTRGLCLSEEQTCTSNRGGPRIRGTRTQTPKLTRKCQVTAILVLYSLPRLLTGAIIAHELMRSWLRIKGYRNLNPSVEEGICHVLSHLWLENEITKNDAKSDIEKKLGKFVMHQIANDSFPGYHGGYRAASATVNKYGLRHTLNHIRSTGDFPV